MKGQSPVGCDELTEFCCFVIQNYLPTDHNTFLGHLFKQLNRLVLHSIHLVENTAQYFECLLENQAIVLHLKNQDVDFFKCLMHELVDIDENYYSLNETIYNVSLFLLTGSI